MLPEYASPAAGIGSDQVLVGMACIEAPHPAEVAMCPDYCRGTLEVAAGNHLRPCQRVEEPAAKQKPATDAVGQILVHHQQIVAEVQIHLPGISGLKTSSTQMAHRCRRHHGNTESCQPDAPAEVNFLHMGEKLRIQASESHIQLAAHHQRGA